MTLLIGTSGLTVEVMVFWVMKMCSDVVGRVTSLWKWRQHDFLKDCYCTTLVHGVITQKTTPWLFMAVQTWCHTALHCLSCNLRP